MSDPDSGRRRRPALSTRTMEIATALGAARRQRARRVRQLPARLEVGRRRPAIGVLPVLHRAPARHRELARDAGAWADRRRSAPGGIVRRVGAAEARLLGARARVRSTCWRVQLVGMYVASAVYIIVVHALAGSLPVGEERRDRSRRQRDRSSSCSRCGSRFPCTRAPSTRSRGSATERALADSLSRQVLEAFPWSRSVRSFTASQSCCRRSTCS